MIRCAVDIGGTFTDLVAFDEDSGRLIRRKKLSTSSRLADGVLGVIEKAGIDASEVGILLHGSTVAINAFLEKTGAETALLTTAGFRDVYEMGRKSRPDMYNLFFEQRVPLVPRSRRFEVPERSTAEGTVLRALDEDRLREVLDGLPDQVEALAICFLHAHASPEHEQRAARIAREQLPNAFVTASTEISREIREFERTSTAVLNAYVGPRVSSYLGDLETRLGDRGFEGPMLMTQSNGGMMSLATARQQPVRMMESGPAAGVIGASHVCAELGIDSAIAFDMGGTTAKACVIEGGIPELASEYYVGGARTGFPVQAPFLDIVEVGAGGGSIAHLDPAGGLRVGPESAGSAPGPACYGRGGERATVTDANLLVGRIDHESFLGGEMRLDFRRAERALGELASGLGISSDEAAQGVIRVADSIMGHAIRSVTIERGRDPRDYALVCYGGAGPLHAVDLAAQLEIPRVVVPTGASTFASFGMLVSDLRHDAAASYIRRLSELDAAEAEALFTELREGARELLEEEGGGGEPVGFIHRIDARYLGQFHTLSLETTVPFELAALEQGFHLEHERRYGHSAVGEEIEVTALRATAVLRLSRPSPQPAPQAGEKGPSGTRRVMLESDGWTQCTIWDRDELASGQQLEGPAVIQESNTATILRDGDRATIGAGAHILIEMREASA
jgi:N-methylhydantoinase A